MGRIDGLINLVQSYQVMRF